jgi:glucose-1-phosphate thymidylyltransferase
MNLLVLAAGYAIRLYPLTKNTAKPLIDIAGQPILDRLLASFDTIPDIKRSVLISNGRFAPDFDHWLGQRTPSRPELQPELINNSSMCREEKRGAVADLHLALEKGALYDDDLIIVGGDNLFAKPQTGFINASRSRPASIATYDVGCTETVKRFASLEIDADEKITAFTEKPTEPKTTIAGTAFYFFQKDTLREIDRYIEEGNHPDNAGYLFQWLFPRIPTYAHPVDGLWFDIGDFAALEQARQAFSA